MSRARSLRGTTACAALLPMLLLTVTPARAQSLGEVARREAERRSRIEAGRAYTNEDLPEVEPPATVAAPGNRPPDAAPAGTTSNEASAAPDTEATQSDSPKPPPAESREEQFRKTLEEALSAREAKTNREIAAQQARLAELDEMPRTPTTMRERDVISATLMRLQKSAASHARERTRLTPPSPTGSESEGETR